jgi:hypothetical protein
MEVSGQKMGMIIVLLCGAVLGTAIRISAVPLAATTATAAATAATAVFGWCAVLGGLCNPFSLFSLFTLIPYFFSFLFFPARFLGFWGDFGVIWAHAMRPFGFWGYLGYLGARDAPLRFLGEFGNLGARDAPLRVLDAAEGEKPPHQVNLDTFREKIFLHRESLK